MDRAKESLQLIWDVWVLMCTTGMSLLIAFTVLAWVMGMIDPQFLRPPTAPAPRRVIESHERIPPTNFPVTAPE